MEKHDKLIKKLREYSGCRKGELARITSDAAAAIEELQAELDKYHELCDVDEIPEVLEILMTV